METMTQTSKKLTKIKLVNWHYFTNETIAIKDSTLFTGENGSGKSTILDAIQLVLTTNSRRFNPAANEKSKRDLKGYVRCKTGEEGNTYVRGSGPVISYVALEFYEELKDRYFVLGVKIDSPDLEGELDKKWFRVEGKLDSLSFLVGDKPATDREFTQNGKKITFEKQTGRAKDDFKDRLGHLEENFFDMIIKSMAFKPLDNVKSFINQYILPKEDIDIKKLQESINALREMQSLIEQVKARIGKLDQIIAKADEIKESNEKILVIDLLIKIAELKANEQRLTTLLSQLDAEKLDLEAIRKAKTVIEEECRALDEEYTQVKVAIASNENAKLIENLKHQLEWVSRDLQSAEEGEKKLKEQVHHCRQIRGEGYETDLSYIDEFLSSKTEIEQKNQLFTKLKKSVTDLQSRLFTDKANATNKEAEQKKKKAELEGRIANLEKHKLTFDPNVTELRDAINTEFRARRLDTEAKVFSDLLEIEKPEWQSAVEGYLNTQRFNIIVEPRHYDIAAEVYHKIKDRIHTVGLVNTGKLALDEVPAENTLASVVSSENRYARAYANYVLGRVVCCGSVHELKQFDIAVTADCMLYQGHVLRKISDKVYRTPYIGKYAVERQLEIARKELSTLRNDIEENQTVLQNINFVIGKVENCDLNAIQSSMDSPYEKKIQLSKKRKLEMDLEEAKKNPDLISLMEKETSVQKKLDAKKSSLGDTQQKETNKERDIKDHEAKKSDIENTIAQNKEQLQAMSSGNDGAYMKATEMYDDNFRSKTADVILYNYQPRKQTLLNQRDKQKEELITLQANYEGGELGTGIEIMDDYFAEREKLNRSDLVKYEDQVTRNRENCEVEFRENFLAKMRENIERAKDIFAKLNRSLKGVYYGNDSYKFELTSNANKNKLYEMITSNVNVAGMTLFSQVFDEEYHEEMEDLFAKLTDSSLDGDAVLSEYADYRSYLDYDILVVTRDGKTQRFSKTYGEKSGGETQTPYYVAIAASFAQMYSGGETVRLILFDEAFNNMDDDRIESMMKFLREQKFQIILAAPPARAEIIGQYVTTFDSVFHSGSYSWVEPYELPEN